MKNLFLLFIVLFLISCETEEPEKNTKHITQDTMKKASWEDLGYAAVRFIEFIQDLGDTIIASSSPGLALQQKIEKRSTIVFIDTTQNTNKRLVTIRLHKPASKKFDKIKDSDISSIFIKTNKKDIEIPSSLLDSITGIVPANIEVYRSENFKNILIYPYGLSKKDSLTFKINVTNGKIRAKTKNGYYYLIL